MSYQYDFSQPIYMHNTRHIGKTAHLCCITKQLNFPNLSRKYDCGKNHYCRCSITRCLLIYTRYFLNGQYESIDQNIITRDYVRFPPNGQCETINKSIINLWAFISKSSVRINWQNPYHTVAIYLYASFSKRSVWTHWQKLSKCVTFAGFRCYEGYLVQLKANICGYIVCEYVFIPGKSFS